MHNVLIADDETIVRLMLSSMIDWDGMELNLIACVVNGREAVTYLEQEQIDILITDIQMPVVDGLSLIRYAKEMEYVPEILVLSAYNDFSYVRQAFKMGIYDYCLKREIHEEMLKKHLQNMKQNLLQNGRIERCEKQQEEDQTCLLGQLLRGEIEAKEAKLPENYYVVYYSIEDYQNVVKNFGSDFDKNFFISLLGLARQITQIAKYGSIVPMGIANLVMIYEVREDNALPSLLRVCNRLLHAWKNYMNINIIASVSCIGCGAEMFECCLQEATMNMTMKYVMKSQKLFSPEDYEKFSPEKACAREEDYKAIIDALKLNDSIRYEAEKTKILMNMQKAEAEEASRQALYLAYHIAAALVHQLEDTDYIYSNDLLEEISSLSSSQEVCIWTVHFLSDMKRYVQVHYQFDFPDEIHKAIEYINDYYYKPDLTLYEVASEIGFSEKYFSTLFNKKVGVSFSNYLKSLRIYHAKSMLKETNMKLKEISQVVGYNSVEYFIRVFVAETGISPSAFRKQSHTIVQ